MEALANPSLGATYTGANRWLLRVLPSLTDFAFLVPVLWLFLVMTGSTTILSDGDTGWHIRTGEWIWQHGAVPKTDLFSFTRPHGAWYAWEWLWDLAFAGVHHAGGLGAVAFVNVCFLGLVSVLLFRLIRRTTNNDILSLLCMLAPMSASSLHWLARPHLVSWLFILGFSHAILSAQRGNSKALLWLPLGMLFWTNLHGGFFLGIIMLLLAAAGEVVGAFLHARDFWTAAWSRSRYYLACALACAVTTFVNPYGWQLHAHIAQYVVDGKLLIQIGEFRSMDFHNPLGFFFELVLLAALPAAFWAILRKQYSTALSILAFAHMALYSARNIPIFVFIAAPPVALMINDLLHRAQPCFRLRNAITKLIRFEESIRPFERTGRLYVCSALTMIVLAVSFAQSLPGFQGKFDKVTFPTSALPIIEKAKFAHLFTTDTWASYFIYNLYPHQPSYMDGRSDYFGSKFLERYGHVINARWDWEEDLNSYSVDGVLLRTDAPVVAALKSSRNWSVLFDDGSVIIFKRVQTRLNPPASARVTQVSPVQLDGRKKLGTNKPGLIVSSMTKSQERRS